MTEPRAATVDEAARTAEREAAAAFLQGLADGARARPSATTEIVVRG